MSESAAPWYRRPLVVTATALALLAYLPALTAAPGRMPSDSKLYLYLNPGRFLGDAATTFDPRQFAGWVPHQHVAYLWPAGPWFWLFESLGVPDWVAHRLWIGTIMLAAGLGVRWTARLLGLAPLAAACAAIVYQLSLYILPYVSRTSVMLLPWAGLGWIVAFTIRATRRGGWADPAAVALVVFTVGAVNATALAMVVPAPVLWIVHEVWRRSIDWRRALATAARVGALSLAVSLWWMAMLVIQGRRGVDVLPYSESLADVSLTASASEVWRSLGYWLFYVRDPYAATTTESLRYLSSSPAIVVSFLVPLIGLVGLVWVRWVHRRYAALLIATGVVLAVGVHPIDDRSPLMRLFAGDDESGLALALRSSTRALPLLMLGIALSTAAVITAAGPFRLRRPSVDVAHVSAAVVVLVAITNLPAVWTGAFVDPALERDQDPPPAWIEAATALDASGDAGRVLQLPGQEFGAYRWGYTVDQPLPGLTDKPLVTRDLLPLGSAGAMDLLFALDDRAQGGSLEPESLAPIARLLGVDTIWVTNDSAFDRFRTARPEVVGDLVDGAPGVGTAATFGQPFVNRPDVPVTDERAVGDPRVGEPLLPVALHPLDEPGAVVRASARSIVVSGSGDGLVDAAAAGLIDGHTTVRYSATLEGDELTDAVAEAGGLIVTDSNRDRARHWRSSQDTTGFTETGGPDQDVLRDVASDTRLPVFDDTDPVTQTISVGIGAIATATAYGEPFAYLPEHRPAMAIDGDPHTSWLVGERGDPVGETLRLEQPASAALSGAQLHLLQPAEPGHRRIAAVDVTTTVVGGATTEERVDLDDRSVTTPGQTVDLPDDATRVDITIAAVEGGEPFTAGFVTGVGFLEVGVVGEEYIRPPHDALDIAEPEIPLALVFSRLRVDPTNRWRDDVEPTLRRVFDLPTPRRMTVAPTVRIDARADDATLADLLGWPVRASSRLMGSPRHAGAAAFDGDPETAWITAFGEAAGARVEIDGIDQQVATISIRQPVAGFSAVTEVTVSSAGASRTAAVQPDAGGTATVVLDPPLPAGTVSVELTGIDVSTTVDRRHADVVELPAAVSEIVIAGAPPVDLTPTVELECQPLGTLDGEDVSATITISGDAWLDGAPLIAAPCETSLDLSAGRHRLDGTPPAGLQLDRLVLDDGVGSAAAADRTETTVVERSRTHRTVTVDGCTDGCWLVLGEGYSDGWSATADGVSLGEPELVDGGFNGWWLDGSTGTTEVEMRWDSQRLLDIALILSLLAAAVATALVIAGRRRLSHDDEEIDAPPTFDADEPDRARRLPWPVLVAWVAVPALLIGPSWALWGALGALVVVVSRRRRLAELTALCSVAVVGVVVTFVERRDHPFPNGGWPGEFESLHGVGMFAVACIVVAVFAADDALAPTSIAPADDESPPAPTDDR